MSSILMLRECCFTMSIVREGRRKVARESPKKKASTIDFSPFWCPMKMISPRKNFLFLQNNPRFSTRPAQPFFNYSLGGIARPNIIYVREHATKKNIRQIEKIMSETSKAISPATVSSDSKDKKMRQKRIPKESPKIPTILKGGAKKAKLEKRTGLQERKNTKKKLSKAIEMQKTHHTFGKGNMPIEKHRNIGKELLKTNTKKDLKQPVSLRGKPHIMAYEKGQNEYTKKSYSKKFKDATQDEKILQETKQQRKKLRGTLRAEKFQVLE